KQAANGNPATSNAASSSAQQKAGQVARDPKTAVSNNELVAPPAKPNAPAAGPQVPLTWADKTPIPTRRGRHAVAAVGSSLYAIGGETWNGTAYVTTASMERYNQATDTYTALAAMPAAYSNIEACAMNGKIYI